MDSDRETAAETRELTAWLLKTQRAGMGLWVGGKLKRRGQVFPYS